MTKDVLLTIQGLQFAAEEGSEKLETMTRAEYYKKNDTHYIIYEEVVEGFREVIKSMIKVNDGMLSLTKKGVVNAHLVFEENKKNITNYQTPYGDVYVGIDTKRIFVDEAEEKIRVEVDYGLEMNYEHVADCNIKIDVCAGE